MTDIESDLPDLGRVSLGDLLTAENLDEQIRRVRDRVERPGTSISGFNGAGAGVDGGALDG